MRAGVARCRARTRYSCPLRHEHLPSSPQRKLGSRAVSEVAFGALRRNHCFIRHPLAMGTTPVWAGSREPKARLAGMATCSFGLGPAKHRPAYCPHPTTYPPTTYHALRTASSRTLRTMCWEVTARAPCRCMIFCTSGTPYTLPWMRCE